MSKKFTDAETEHYYNTVEIQYQIPWNPDGSKHWGYFDDLNVPDEEEALFRASNRWNDYMLSKSGINADSRVLDIGCGNGHTAIYLAHQTQCEVVGIDISQIHVDNAQKEAEKFPQLKLSFVKASATSLPFSQGEFTHLWSQGTLLHIHEREVVLQEAYRLLDREGILLFDDLVSLHDHPTEATQTYVYNRLHVSRFISPDSYAEALKSAGFEVLDSLDLRQHMKKFYDIQAKRFQSDTERSFAYRKTSEAVVNGEIAWWFYLCKKS